ncbi:MAG TPA: VOC family protein [Eoetvoesiella sp.]|uniref:VOC family protein n=1 Tax=Eoetvoesiella sp. TaxID=1966355 RepID=UPI002BACEBD5|nr:VOC family protein [Eoetvoesiella sp.]HWK62035.1 VOC family protein [Eoetvoesiella sp.]
MTTIPPYTRPPRRLAHIALRTNQLERMVAWYGCVLGTRIAYASDKVAFLTYDEEHHRIALLAMDDYPARPEQGAVGHVHTAFAYDSLDELMGTYVRLKAENILPRRSIHHGPTVSLYYADPDGNQIELQVDSFPDAESANAWMRSAAFSRNPIGIEFDPEAMLVRMGSGEPESDLLHRPDGV